VTDTQKTGILDHDEHLTKSLNGGTFIGDSLHKLQQQKSLHRDSTYNELVCFPHLYLSKIFSISLNVTFL
jgi:hypothetical protein